MNSNEATVHTKDNFYLISSSDVVTEIGKGILELTGYSNDEIINRDISEVFINLFRLPPETYEKINPKESVDCYIFTKSLEAREVTIFIFFGYNDTTYKVIEKPHTRLNHIFKHEYQLITENVIGISIYSLPDFRLLKANPKYIGFFEAPYNTLENTIGRKIYDFIDGYKGSDLEFIILNTLITGKSAYVNEHKFDGFKRGITYWDRIITPIHIHGRLKYIITNTLDVTERVNNKIQFIKQQEHLMMYEKDRSEALTKSIEIKDEFLSIISHEFKTPLTVINSAIQSMEFFCKGELSDKAKRFLNQIRHNSNRQLKLVNNLLDITRMTSGSLKINKKDLDIVFVTCSITESIAIFAEQKGIKLSFSTTLQKKIIGIDDEKYERILLNLLSNAIKFTPKGKSITVKVSQKIVKGKCKVSIQVRDEGIGIPNDKMELIFERFGQVDSSLTRQAEGTGIGLYLVKMMVELLDGEITLDSKEGKGSTFTILLPIEKANKTPIEQMLIEINDNRLIQAMNIEFSDIYA